MEQNISSYCSSIKKLKEPEHSMHKHYHDFEYGFPLQNDNDLFGRLVLEINQAGLSWSTILKKKENFFDAYDEFRVAVVANYGEEDRSRLLNDTGIIRHRIKIDAAIYNAAVIVELQKQYGSFKEWLDEHHPMSLVQWTRLFKMTFKFVGKEIVHSFLMSIGYLEGAHHRNCPIAKEIAKENPPWIVGKVFKPAPGL